MKEEILISYLEVFYFNLVRFQNMKSRLIHTIDLAESYYVKKLWMTMQLIWDIIKNWIVNHAYIN